MFLKYRNEHLCEWLGENPQWAPEHWCGGASTDIFNHSEHQGFASAKATTYDELINKLCELHDTYNFLVTRSYLLLCIAL
jgi:hypothetical protein